MFCVFKFYFYKEDNEYYIIIKDIETPRGSSWLNAGSNFHIQHLKELCPIRVMSNFDFLDPGR